MDIEVIGGFIGAVGLVTLIIIMFVQALRGSHSQSKQEKTDEARIPVTPCSESAQLCDNCRSPVNRAVPKPKKWRPKMTEGPKTLPPLSQLKFQCQVCGQNADADTEAIAVCEQCESPVHLICLEYNKKRCPTYGCKSESFLSNRWYFLAK